MIYVKQILYNNDKDIIKIISSDDKEYFLSDVLSQIKKEYLLSNADYQDAKMITLLIENSLLQMMGEDVFLNLDFVDIFNSFKKTDSTHDKVLPFVDNSLEDITTKLILDVDAIFTHINILQNSIYLTNRKAGENINNKAILNNQVLDVINSLFIKASKTSLTNEDVALTIINDNMPYILEDKIDPVYKDIDKVYESIMFFMLKTISFLSARYD